MCTLASLCLVDLPSNATIWFPAYEEGLARREDRPPEHEEEVDGNGQSLLAANANVEPRRPATCFFGVWQPPGRSPLSLRTAFINDNSATDGFFLPRGPCKNDLCKGVGRRGQRAEGVLQRVVRGQDEEDAERDANELTRGTRTNTENSCYNCPGL